MLRLRRRPSRKELLALVDEGVEAMRLTREYVGESALPAVPGWSWFDWTSKARTAISESEHRRHAARMSNAASDGPAGTQPITIPPV